MEETPWKLLPLTELAGNVLNIQGINGTKSCENLTLFHQEFGGPLCKRTSLVAQMIKCLPTLWETRVRSLGPEDPLEKEVATRSSALAWTVPWVEKPCRLPAVGSQRARHDWVTSLSLFCVRVIWVKEQNKTAADAHKQTPWRRNLVNGDAEKQKSSRWRQVSSGRRCARACVRAKSLQPCPALCDAVDCPLSTGLSRQARWSGSPCPPPGDLPNPGIEPGSLMSPALAGGFFFTTSTTRKVIGGEE